jgi:hypothetical protein
MSLRRLSSRQSCPIQSSRCSDIFFYPVIHIQSFNHSFPCRPVLHLLHLLSSPALGYGFILLPVLYYPMLKGVGFFSYLRSGSNRVPSFYFGRCKNPKARKVRKETTHSFYLLLLHHNFLGPYFLFSIFLLPNRHLPVYQLYACFVLELEILACSSSYYIRAFGLHSLPLSAPLLDCYSSLFLAFPFSPCLSSIDLIRHFLLFINLSPYFRHACNGLLSPDR